MRLSFATENAAVTCSHLLFVGDGWVPATKVPCWWSDEDDYAWRFTGPTSDVLRYLDYDPASPQPPNPRESQ